MNVPYLDLRAEFNTEEVFAVVKEQLEKAFFVGGPAIDEFEERFAKVCGTRFSIGVNSGTDALFLVMRALGIGPGDEVITAPNSFLASAGAVAQAGATPTFCDVRSDYMLDPDKLEAAITDKTRAIIPVHLTGAPAPMGQIMEIATARGLHVIEDCAQAICATENGKLVGSFGIAGGFSLHPLKNLPVAGDGGMITTDDEELRDRLLILRNHGLIDRNTTAEFAYNSRLDAIQAAIGNVGLDRLEGITKRRIENAKRYDRLLGGLEPNVVLPPRRAEGVTVFHTYVIQVERRDELQAHLLEKGIETKIHYPIPIHLQPPCRAMGHSEGDFPVCESQAVRIISLPIHQHLTPEQIDYVAQVITAFYG